MKKVLKWIGKVILILVALVVILIAALLIKARHDASIPIVASDYQAVTPTGGEIEAKYLANGDHVVSYYEREADERIGKYEIFYPADLSALCPVIVYCNGSGVKGSDCTPLFRHWASWGFIVAANEESSSWDGSCAEKTLSFLIAENENPESALYGKVDLDRVGITGHSQGGVSVFNAVTNYELSSMYQTAVPISPTQESLAEGLGWHYDLTKVTIPVLLLAGTKGSGEMKTVLPREAMDSMYEKLGVPKAMARKLGCEHNDTDTALDGYVTAWMMWQLQGDEYAGSVFQSGGELSQNSLYESQRTDIAR